MNREQMEAWCALEGLEPVLCCGEPRVIRQDHDTFQTMLTYNGRWNIAQSTWNRAKYTPCSWYASDAYGLLTIELLTELTKK